MNLHEASIDLLEGKAEGQIISKMLTMTKALMKEVDKLSKIDNGDLHDQITNMDHFTTKLRDTILRANKVNPK
jgi:hypothetical protein